MDYMQDVDVKKHKLIGDENDIDQDKRTMFKEIANIAMPAIGC